MIRNINSTALLVTALGLLWLAGCSQPPQGTEVTVRLSSPWGVPATATVDYQVGDGEWKLATQKDYGVYGFTVPPGEVRYGVAVNCIPVGFGLGTLGWANVYQLTLDDTKELQVACLNLSDLSTTEVKVKARAGGGDTGYDRAWYYSELDDGRKTFPNNATLLSKAEANRDVLIVAYASGSSKYNPGLIRRIKFLHNLDASSTPVAPLDVELTAADQPTTQTVGAFSKPGWSAAASFGVGFVSSQGLTVPFTASAPDENPALGSGDEAGGSYYKIPNTRPGDVYYAEASAWDAARNHLVHFSQVLDYDGPQLNIELPARKFDPAVSAGALPVFTGLEYSDPDLKGYAFSINFSGFWEMIVVSKAWLDAKTSYAVPDLSSAPDFRGTRPLKGEELRWRALAVMANHELGEILTGDPLPLPNPVPRTPGLWMKLAVKQGKFTVP